MNHVEVYCEQAEISARGGIMSTWIGHGLAAAGLTEAWRKHDEHYPTWPWILWISICACVPDVDYLVHFLSGWQPEMRYTHSIVGSLLLPAITTVWLYGLGVPQRKYILACACFAGLSHLVLDLLVGVTPLPLLWPFSNSLVLLPFGILPSAGQLSVSNPFLYRNLIIEIGSVGSLSWLVFHKRRHTGSRWVNMLLLATAGVCIIIGAWLAR